MTILPETQLQLGHQTVKEATIFFSLSLGTPKTCCYWNAAGDANAKTCNQKSIHIIRTRQRSSVKSSFILIPAMRIWLCIMFWILHCLRNSRIFLALFGLDPTFPNWTSQLENNN
jgi:hypothetical protein